MEKLYHGTREKTLSIFYLFIYLFIYTSEGNLLLWEGHKGCGEGCGGRWALREADFNRPTHNYAKRTVVYNHLVYFHSREVIKATK